jgi:23S rRNA pseudouridine2605 synthase
MAEPIRLQKALAQAGVASRRAAEILIDEGRVSVNGQVVAEQGTRVDPSVAVIKVDGKRIPPMRDHLYLVLNKPTGVVSSMDDPQGRPTLIDFLGKRRKAGLFHVGRLDVDTEGLLLLTNDGEFAQRMSHPSYEVPKTYLAEVSGELDAKAIARLRKGVELDDGPVQVDKVKLLERARARSLVQVTLHSGRNRVVRRMFEALGHPVRKLARIAIGPLRATGLRPGQLRELTQAERAALFELVEL